MDYDSDSSGLSDQEEYTETGVLLGYSSKEPTDDHISHLGGHPSWLSSNTPSGAFAKCKVCQSPMSLLLQLSGDLPEHFPNDERRLYIFSCRKKACTRKPGSIRALREARKIRSERKQRSTENSIQPSSAPPPSQQQQDLGAALFGTGSKSPPPSSKTNPFSMPSTTNGSSTPANPFAPLPPTSSLAAIPPQTPSEPPLQQSTLPETFASKLHVSSSQTTSSTPQSTASEPWPDLSSFPPPYPTLHLDADYETLTPTASTNNASSSSPTNIQYEDTEPSSSGGASSSNKDSFESTLDKTFLRFSDRLAQNPEQVLRYEWNGTPLLYSSNDAVASRFPTLFHPSNKTKITTTSNSNNKIPRCEHCGAGRIFEFQLVPGLIAALEEEEGGLAGDLEEGMEWGTILLGVCERNCCGDVGEVVYREEWVGVQWEERVSR